MHELEPSASQIFVAFLGWARALAGVDARTHADRAFGNAPCAVRGAVRALSPWREMRSVGSASLELGVCTRDPARWEETVKPKEPLERESQEGEMR